MRLIKKYKNRRLYDMEKSQYITVEELQQLVVEGVMFQVIDVRDNQDITGMTLLQILVEMESGAGKFFSVDMLRQLIIAVQHPLNQTYKKACEQFFTALEKSTKATPYFNEYKQVSAEWQKNFQDLIAHWQDFFKV